jgi:hypothetical protein
MMKLIGRDVILIGRDVENMRPNLEYSLGICLDRLRKTGLKPSQDRMCPG